MKIYNKRYLAIYLNAATVVLGIVYLLIDREINKLLYGYAGTSQLFFILFPLFACVLINNIIFALMVDAFFCYFIFWIVLMRFKIQDNGGHIPNGYGEWGWYPAIITTETVIWIVVCFVISVFVKKRSKR